MSVETPEVIPATDSPPPTPPPATDPPTDPPAPEASATDRDDKGRFRNPVQPRIDELTRKVRENEREAAFWRARAEAAEKPPAPPAQKPTPDKFDDYGAYVEALTEFKADEKVKKAFETHDQQQTEKQQTETRQSTWQQRKAEAAKSIPDLDAVLSASEVPLSAAVQAELLDSEWGPQIAYHLDKHPELAEKLNGLTDKQVAREIGRLEVTIGTPIKGAESPETPETPDPEPIIKKTTSAPPPVKPIGQGRSTAVDLSKASMDDYVKARVAQGASWARR